MMVMSPDLIGKFMIQWSYITSLVTRDLTLRSAQSFGVCDGFRNLGVVFRPRLLVYGTLGKHGRVANRLALLTYFWAGELFGLLCV
jgi:hypothetical protein